MRHKGGNGVELSALKQRLRRPPVLVSKDIAVSIRQRDALRYVQFRHEGRADKAYHFSVDLNKLELYQFIKTTYVALKAGQIQGPIWTNTDIKLSKMAKTEFFALTYYLIKSFLRLSTARDIWAAFPKVHNTLLSYLKDRASFTHLVLNYKVAFLTCWFNDYGINDLTRIGKVFRDCGLSPDNSIFYLLALMTGDMEGFVQEHDEEYELTVEALTKEIDAFISSASALRLCNYNVYKKLMFVCQSHKLDVNDLSMELLTNTLVAYRLARPQRSRLHAENYARRAMTNAVHRILYAVTNFEGLKNIWQDESGQFVTRHVTLSSNSEPSLSVDPLFPDSGISMSLGFNEDMMHEIIDAKRSA